MKLSIEQFRSGGREFWDLCDSVPFGHSRFQNERFVLNHVLPGRSYRQAVLELSQRAKAFNKAIADRMRSQAKIRIRERAIRWLRFVRFLPFVKDCITLLDASVREENFNLKMQEKYERDAAEEVKTLCAVLSRLPAFDRESFEKEEPRYWLDRLMIESRHSLVANGTLPAGHLETLHKMGLLPEEVRLKLEADRDVNVAALLEGAKKQLEAPPKKP